MRRGTLWYKPHRIESHLTSILDDVTISTCDAWAAQELGVPLSAPFIEVNPLYCQIASGRVEKQRTEGLSWLHDHNCRKQALTLIENWPSQLRGLDPE